MSLSTSHSHAPHRHVITKHEINALPLRTYTGPIRLVDTDEKMAAAARSLHGEKVLGFDTETRPAFKKGESYKPSLVQLAGSKEVFIFQLRNLTSYEPLAAILADKHILKAGVAVDDDIRKLKDVFFHGAAGFVELAGMASKAGIKNAGVRGLAALLFGFRISKQTRCSAWHAATLTEPQLVYAATDAWVCREIYYALMGRVAA